MNTKQLLPQHLVSLISLLIKQMTVFGPE